MRQRYQRLNAILVTLIHNIVIELKAKLVRSLFKACWINSGPVDREPKYLESHLDEKGNVFFVMMEEIDTIVARIILIRVKRWSNLTRMVMVTVCSHIHTAWTLTIYIPSTLKLISSCCATPQKILWKCHIHSLIISSNKLWATSSQEPVAQKAPLV